MAFRDFPSSRPNRSLFNFTGGPQRQRLNCMPNHFPNFQNKVTSFEAYTLALTSLINFMTITPAIVGNIFVLLVLIWKPRLRSNSHLILGCLATTDVLVGAVIQPLLVTVNIQYLTSSVSLRTCALYVVYDVVKYVCGLCSSCVSIIVTADRSLAVSLPYVYVVSVTKTRVIVTCVATWIICISFAVFRFFSPKGRLFAVIFIVFLSISFTTVAILYVKMLCIANRHRLQIITQDRVAQKRHCTERKALKTAIIIIGAYCICYLPYIIARLYFVNVKTNRAFRYAFMLWPKTLLYVNSSLNPFILFWRMKKMRKALRETLTIIFCCFGPSRA